MMSKEIKAIQKTRIPLSMIMCVAGAMQAGIEIYCKDKTVWRTYEFHVIADYITGTFIRFDQY